MIPSPIAKALSILCSHDVAFLLMGGQACIVYGAAEFSRDMDVALLVSGDNLARLRAALTDLGAETAYVPELSDEVLRRGHACHFICNAAGLDGLRVDVMGCMRGVEDFPRLWERRRQIPIEGVGQVPVMALPDLVAAKKTQRDKDWPMIRRLVEADIFHAGDDASPERVAFWLAECRTPEVLARLVARYPERAADVAVSRPVVRAVASGASSDELEHLLLDEQQRVREADRAYWRPLRQELEAWRHARSRRE